jgi:NitT/TauT family transport system ATP-binding protein
MPVLIEQISKTYRDRRGRTLEALADIDFIVRDREFLTILGPSGSGKTTLLQIVAGLLAPSAGRVVFEGVCPNGRPLSSVVFQEGALFPWRTVEKNIQFGLEEKGRGKKERRKIAADFMQLVGLSGFADRYPHQLSGGLKQRAALARALAVDPYLLLMDEPFSALDAQTRALMQTELSRIWEQARNSVLYVTHNIREAVFLSDRVLLLSRRPGRVMDLVSIDLPRPRREEVTRVRAFQTYLDYLWGRIKDQARESLEEDWCRK